MRKEKIVRNLVNMFLTLIIFMGTAGAQTYSALGMYQCHKPDKLKF